MTGLRAEPQLTALAIVGPLGEKHPEQFGTQHHSILQRLLKALRKNAVEKLTAQEPVGATAAAISPEALDSSGYRGLDPPMARPIEHTSKLPHRSLSFQADLRCPHFAVMWQRLSDQSFSSLR
jgi:hypothetical protein